MKPSPLYSAVRKRQNLHSAWKKVFANGIRSQAKETRNQVRAFAEDAFRHLDRLQRLLRKGKFDFAPATGVLIPRPGKPPRPIVIASIENRIVQRSILEVLQNHDAIQPYVLVPNSFGGLKDDDGGRRVQDAVFKAWQEATNGKGWYLRSDIKNFFTQIDRAKVLGIVGKLIDDTLFLNLLETALTTELENLDSLKEKKDLFPIYEIGVAQGCCLSPLVGNILLHDFDLKMNQKGITCLRYIDDFLVLGKKRQHVQKAFDTALRLLERLGLTAYHPMTNPEKADFGRTDNGFEFLGCHISPEKIRPSKKSCQNLLGKIDQAFKYSSRRMISPKSLRPEKLALVDTLKSVSNMLEGWGNQYSFCNCDELLQDLDRQIDERLSKYLGIYTNYREKFQDNATSLRRLLGVHPLVDSYSDPQITH